MKHAIGYLRVSTREQGRSGLGLAAQRHDIEAFGGREGLSIKSWHQDIQTGAGKDALLLRPGLAAALKEARAARCPLIVSRLDRLSRNVHFITGLMEHKVHFVVAALGRDCDEFTLHIYASLAEQERKMISERIRAAAAVRRRKGIKHGLALRSKAYGQRLRKLGHAAVKRAAIERAEAYRLHIEWALRQPARFGTGRPISFGGAANKLNERNIESPTGAIWRGDLLQRMVPRLGLQHPPGYVRADLVRERVRALWKTHPEYTVKQVIANLGFEHPVGFTRIEKMWREFRLPFARRNRVHRRMKWPLDCRTTTRIRIAAIWRQHPEFTARRVIAKLGPGPFRKIKWVQEILKQCWRASGRHSPKHWQKGRRFFSFPA